MSKKTLKDLMKVMYPVITEWIEDEGDKYCLVYHPDFGKSACSAAGENPSEAMENLREVKEFLFSHYLETGDPIPEPFSYLDKEK